MADDIIDPRLWAALRNPEIEIPGEAAALANIERWIYDASVPVLPCDRFMYQPGKADTDTPASHRERESPKGAGGDS